MLGWIKEYKRNKLLRNCRKDVATDFINLGDVSSMGFIFAITSQESVALLMDIYKVFKSKGVPFKGLAIETRKNVFSREVPQTAGNSQAGGNSQAAGNSQAGENSQTAENSQSGATSHKGGKPQPVIPEELAQAVWLKVIPYEKLNWLGVVEQTEVEDFFRSQTDLFISFNSTGCFTLDYTFANYVKSPMRIGMVNNPDMPYSMVVEGKDKSVLAPMDYLEQVFHYLDVIKTSTIKI